MMRTILHSDCNNFYASVECVLHPEWRGLPLAVCGDPEQRHGIVLAKSEQAKQYGVKTGETIWQARRKCPGLRVVPPTYGQYTWFSHRMRAIYGQFTDRVEPFGLDECWLDLGGCAKEGTRAAAEIRRLARTELGITVSIGVSFNKVFAKLGSDLRKPDATTLITPENFREKLWPLPAEDMLFIGRRVRTALRLRGISTIGDVAWADPVLLRSTFGKNGETLRQWALGLDFSPVSRADERVIPKSIGNSTTPPRDVETEEDARVVLRALCDEVAFRLRTEGMKCRCVSLWLRDKWLFSSERQRALTRFTFLSGDLFDAAFSLLLSGWDGRPLRSLGVRAAALRSDSQGDQTSLWRNEKREKQERLAKTLDDIAARFGENAVRRAVLIGKNVLTGE